MSKNKPAGKGIVLIALGNAHYGRMAANTAASIRHSDPDVNIHLVYTGGAISHLSDKHKVLFTSMAPCPQHCYTQQGAVNYLKAKTHIWELSPYEETILIDVDLLIFGQNRVSKWFDSLKDVDF